MIGFQSGGRLITDWAGQACGRHTVARVYVTRKEKKNLTGYISADQPTAAGGLLVAVYRKKSSLETRDELRRGAAVAAAARGDTGGRGPARMILNTIIII